MHLKRTHLVSIMFLFKVDMDYIPSFLCTFSSNVKLNPYYQILSDTLEHFTCIFTHVLVYINCFKDLLYFQFRQVNSSALCCFADLRIRPQCQYFYALSYSYGLQNHY
jgi:hypothetical protein